MKQVLIICLLLVFSLSSCRVRTHPEGASPITSESADMPLGSPSGMGMGMMERHHGSIPPD